jgi:hypothetical protein
VDCQGSFTVAFIPGGIFRMGSDCHNLEEAPVQRVTVGGNWIDRASVIKDSSENSSAIPVYIT